MLKCGLLRNLINQRGAFLRVTSYHNRAFIYGNQNMPDHLYKTIELEMKSAEPAVLKSYESFIVMAANNLEIPVGQRWHTKPTKKRWTVLKSVFVYRKHMVQYEVRTYYRWIQLHKMTGSTADTFLEYIERMLPEGVGLKVTRLSIEPLPSHISEEEIKKTIAGADLETSKETEAIPDSLGQQEKVQ